MLLYSECHSCGHQCFGWNCCRILHCFGCHCCIYNIVPLMPLLWMPELWMLLLQMPLLWMPLLWGYNCCKCRRLVAYVFGCFRLLQNASCRMAVAECLLQTVAGEWCHSVVLCLGLCQLGITGNEAADVAPEATPASLRLVLKSVLKCEQSCITSCTAWVSSWKPFSGSLQHFGTHMVAGGRSKGS